MCYLVSFLLKCFQTIIYESCNKILCIFKENFNKTFILQFYTFLLLSITLLFYLPFAAQIALMVINFRLFFLILLISQAY